MYEASYLIWLVLQLEIRAVIEVASGRLRDLPEFESSLLGQKRFFAIFGLTKRLPLLPLLFLARLFAGRVNLNFGVGLPPVMENRRIGFCFLPGVFADQIADIFLLFGVESADEILVDVASGFARKVL